ncbi:MAG: hypothetical protein HKN68_21345 [Saprospiraceae bacterium]|nr:hypothetical protein [Saprospiraceae bacterium]
MKHIWILFLVFMINGVSAQPAYLENNNYLIQPFELPDGPSGNSINSIVQGPNGFLWFGGHAGLYRYDGYQFKSYQSDSKDSTSFDFAYIEYLYWSSDEYLWIGTYGGGLFRFDPSDDTFLRFQNNPEDPHSLSNNRITTIIEESKNVLWVGTVDGLNHLDRSTGKFTRFQNDPDDSSSLSYNDVRTLYIDRSGTLWVGTGFMFQSDKSQGGLNRFNPDDQSFTRYSLPKGNDKNPKANIIKAIYEDSRENFWVGGSGGLYNMNRDAGSFEKMIDDPTVEGDFYIPGIRENEHTSVFSLLEDEEKNLWVFTLHDNPDRPLSTIVIADLASQKMEVLAERSPIVPWQAIQSTDGSIWLAGAGVGGQVHQITPGNSQIQYLPFPSDRNLFFQGLVANDENIIWGKTTDENGIIQIVGIENDFKSIGIRSLTEIKTTLSKRSYFSNPGSELVVDSKGTIWGCTGHLYGGVFSISPETAEADQYLHDPNNTNSPPSNFIWTIMKDKSGKIWMGSENGISRLDSESGMYTHFVHDPDDPASLSAGSYFILYEDKDGYIWCGGDRYNNPPFLNRLDPKTGEVKKILFPPEFLAHRPYSIAQNPNGDIIYLLRGKGLYILFNESLKAESWEKDYQGEVILGEALRSANNMVADDQGILWLTTDQGRILRYDSETQSTIEFNDRTGLEFEDQKVYRLNDGSIYFVHEEGLVKVNPTEKIVESKSNSAQVRFTELYVNGQLVSGLEENITNKPIWREDQINLSHDQSNFSLRFSAFDLKDPNNCQYEVRLLPLETTWRRIEGNPFVNYFQLPSGHYTLEVKGSDSNGVWANETKKLEIVITPPWWRSWWAYITYLLLVAMAARWIHKYQKEKTIRTEREKTREKELAHAREIEKAYTDLKATQAQLIHAEKMASLGELTAGIAHEIQNPLNFVNNFSEVSHEMIQEVKEELKDGDPEEADAILNDLSTNLEKISHHGNRASGIVRSMLDHSRTSSGEKVETDINALCDEYLRLAYHGMRAKDRNFNADFKLDLDPDLPKVKVIPQDIGRVLLNLINNAFQAVSEMTSLEVMSSLKPRVEVKTKKLGDKIEISVSDNGPGIPDDIKDKIFQPFFTTKPTGQGTGLGLSLSYDIVKAHGGKFQVESKEGGGTAFLISLPVNAE